MERDEIKKRLKADFGDKEDLLLNAIEEYEMLFQGKYLTLDEVIDRINNNLSNIEFGALRKADGAYSTDSRKIRIKSGVQENKGKIGHVFFHEFMHCILQNDLNNGFREHGNHIYGDYMFLDNL